MASNHTRNTEGLKSTALRKKQAAAEKVDKVIKQLIQMREKVNFNTVSERAGVSKAYLYSVKAIRERIELLRSHQEGLPSPKQVKREMTDASKDVVIATKNKRIKDLETEVKKLKGMMGQKYSEMYENSR